MKIFRAILAFIILSSMGSTLLALDFLNDPFFKQLASELDSMFGEESAAPAKATKAAKPSSGTNASREKEASSKSDNTTQAVHDASKDLKTLFIENLTATKLPEKTPTSMFGSRAPAQKLVISARKKQAYNYYMNDFVKKIRFIERFVAGNPGRSFDHNFIVIFDEVVDFIDQIDASHHLINSKKLYLRNFFSPSMQKTREQIIAIIPKLDAMLQKLRPLLKKEESVDDDIARMQRAAGIPSSKASTHKKQPKERYSAPKPKKFSHSPKKNLRHKAKPTIKKDVPPPTFPASFAVEKLLKKGRLS